MAFFIFFFKSFIFKYVLLLSPKLFSSGFIFLKLRKVQEIRSVLSGLLMLPGNILIMYSFLCVM